MRQHRIMLGLALSAVLFATGCAHRPLQSVDYTAFRQAKPRSLLVLPPVNESPDVNASFSMLSQVTFPLAESGYYVMPVTLVAETFKQNGLSNPPEMHAVAPAKLKEIFGADAALYIKIKRYGTTYTVLNSAAIVAAEANLIDLQTGSTLWTGSASASNAENSNNNSGGLGGLLVAAIVKQIINSTTDAAHPVAGITSSRLLSAGHVNGLLYGPRSPKYGLDGQN
ncbi:MAG: DUF799 domain-containing protein [Aquabacterium sp.]|uniref:DUF799 domain-containing protein n=1 Tax=Aquabacterium sp. TaxID=1872578 RepID=UPI0025C34031|nr:DUF799 domain-containing protein [Aquabacterium sp.]MBI3384389.1 DUF799 domain-containing protein [Aquabacterium sp.]